MIKNKKSLKFNIDNKNNKFKINSKLIKQLIQIYKMNQKKLKVWIFPLKIYKIQKKLYQLINNY